MKRSERTRALEEDWCDIGVGAITSSIDNLEFAVESNRYLDLHFALLVRDHNAKHFKKAADIRAMEELSIGYSTNAYFVRSNHYKLPNAKLIEYDSSRQFMEQDEKEQADAYICSAEIGAVLAMIDPRYSVVVPEGTVAKTPLVIGIVPGDPHLANLVSTWVDLKRDDGTVQALYNHWVLGEQFKQRPPRWSILDDVILKEE